MQVVVQRDAVVADPDLPHPLTQEHRSGLDRCPDQPGIELRARDHPDRPAEPAVHRVGAVGQVEAVHGRPPLGEVVHADLGEGVEDVGGDAVAAGLVPGEVVAVQQQHPHRRSGVEGPERGRRPRRAGRADKPLATGPLAASTVRTACRVAVYATLVFSLVLGWLPGSAQLLSVAAGWAYNLRLKATAWSWLPYAVAFGALAAVPSLALPAIEIVWWLPVVGALLGVGAHLVNVLPDLEDDRATGVSGLPHRLAGRFGRARLPQLAVLLFAVATALLLTAVPFGPVAWLTIALVISLGLVTLAGTGRAPFRAAMAIALVDVVLLAVAL